MQRYIAKILWVIINKWFYDYIVDYMAEEQNESQKKEALEAGYTEKNWEEYWLDKQNRPLEEAYDAGRDQGFQDSYETRL